MTGSIVVFDGVCVLCNGWVDRILRYDRRGRFRLAPMQGRCGRALLKAHGLAVDDPSSFLLVTDGRGYTGSEAVLRVLRGLGGRWRIASIVLRALPQPLRDALYDWLARHRYRLFGRRASCRVPDAAQAWRFLDDDQPIDVTPVRSA